MTWPCPKLHLVQRTVLNGAEHLPGASSLLRFVPGSSWEAGAKLPSYRSTQRLAVSRQLLLPAPAAQNSFTTEQ